MRTTNYQLLERLHAELQPRGYLEIGVRYGDSLRLAKCPAIGIDPNPEVPPSLPHTICHGTSDYFFEHAQEWLDPGTRPRFDVDLVFIDGEHLYEYALRDFLNVCRWANEHTVIVFDDTHPYSQAIATRNQFAEVDWTGDVWKAMDIIQEYGTMRMAEVDVFPTGAFVVWGVTPERVQRFTEFVEAGALTKKSLRNEIQVPDDIIQRRYAVSVDEVVRQIHEYRSDADRSGGLPLDGSR